MDRQISTIERQIVDAAAAMPEDKFNFSSESLNVPAANHKGLRTFALQVKLPSMQYGHIPIVDKFPADILAGTALRA